MKMNKAAAKPAASSRHVPHHQIHDHHKHVEKTAKALHGHDHYKAAHKH